MIFDIVGTISVILIAAFAVLTHVAMRDRGGSL
jgi:hypothetical protein